MNMKKPKMPGMALAPAGVSTGMPKFASRALRPGGMAKGGKIHEDEAMDKKLIRKEIARAEKMESKGMKKGGMAKMAKGGGVETKGKTRGKFV